MLQNRCRHSSVLPHEICSFCNTTTPETLLDICFDYINKHPETICNPGFSSEEDLQLLDGLSLPVEICERLLNVRNNSLTPVDSNFINLFRNTDCTRLKRVKLRRQSEIKDQDLEILLKHNLVELDLSLCPNLTPTCIHHITENSSNLLFLSVGEDTDIFPVRMFGKSPIGQELYDKGYIFYAPNLRKLTLKGLHLLQSDFYMILLYPLSNLTHLDLSNCNDLHDFSYTQHLINLTSLILYNVHGIELMIPAICKLTNLKHLDVSQSKDDQGKYEKGDKILSSIVECLPKLTSLDISGTNLAGRGVAETLNGSVCDIPGLSSRANNPFQYLGLYETSHDACLRHDIPAKLVRTIFFFKYLFSVYVKVSFVDCFKNTLRENFIFFNNSIIST